MEKIGGEFNVWIEFVFTTNHNFFFTKPLLMMIMKMNVMISRMFFLILNKYWECHEITEYLRNYSWRKHVKQMKSFLMAMRNMWWHFRFLFGQKVFLNCLTECQTSCLGYSICLGMLSISIYVYIYIYSINLVSQVTLRSSGTDIYCMVVTCLDVCIIYFISCDCMMNSSLSYTIY